MNKKTSNIFFFQVFKDDLSLLLLLFIIFAIFIWMYVWFLWASNLFLCVKMLTVIRNWKRKWLKKNTKWSKKKNLGYSLQLWCGKKVIKVLEKPESLLIGKRLMAGTPQSCFHLGHVFLAVPLLWVLQSDAPLTVVSVAIKSVLTGDKGCVSGTED